MRGVYSCQDTRAREDERQIVPRIRIYGITHVSIIRRISHLSLRRDTARRLRDGALQAGGAVGGDAIAAECLQQSRQLLTGHAAETIRRRDERSFRVQRRRRRRRRAHLPRGCDLE